MGDVDGVRREEKRPSEAGVEEMNPLGFYISTKIRTCTAIASADRLLDAPKSRESLTDVVLGWP